MICYQITGKGRGKLLGYPTINLAFQGETLEPQIQEGIYAAWVTIKDKRYKGAMHYGPIPTYGETDKSLEVFLLDADDTSLGDLIGTPITVDVIKRIREVLAFSNPEMLTAQITKDVEAVQEILG